MEISARTLREVEFSGSLRGYNTDEVDEFLEKVALALDALQAELRAALERAERLQLQPAEPAGQQVADDDTIRRTLVLAQRAADLAITEAQEEAAQIVGQARSEAEVAVAEARRAAERITEEGQTHLREQVMRLTTTRDGLRAEVDTLTSLLTAERERLKESLGAALRYVERSLMPSAEVVNLPEAAQTGSQQRQGQAKLAAPEALGAESEVGKGPAAPAGQSTDTAGSGPAEAESTRTEEGSSSACTDADDKPPSAEALAAPADPSPPTADDERSVDAGVVVVAEPASWIHDDPADLVAARERAMEEFDDWGLDEPAPPPPTPVGSRSGRLSVAPERRAPHEEARGRLSASTAGMSDRRTERDTARLRRQPASAGSRANQGVTVANWSGGAVEQAWASSAAEHAVVDGDLDDLEAAIAEDAAAAAPSPAAPSPAAPSPAAPSPAAPSPAATPVRRYEDEFDWDAKLPVHQEPPGSSGEQESSPPKLTAMPALDDTVDGAVVWHMTPGGADTPA